MAEGESSHGGGSSAELIEIKVKTLNSTTFTLNVDKNIRVLELKERIATESGVPVAGQRLICRGRVLKDNDLLSSYNMDDGHTLHLVSRHPSEAASGGHPNDQAGSVAPMGPQEVQQVVMGAINVTGADVPQLVWHALNTLGLAGPMQAAAAPSGVPAGPAPQHAPGAPGSQPTVPQQQQQAPGTGDATGGGASARGSPMLSMHGTPAGIEVHIQEAYVPIAGGGNNWGGGGAPGVGGAPIWLPQMFQAPTPPDALSASFHYLNRMNAAFLESEPVLADYLASTAAAAPAYLSTQPRGQSQPATGGAGSANQDAAGTSAGAPSGPPVGSSASGPSSSTTAAVAAATAAASPAPAPAPAPAPQGQEATPAQGGNPRTGEGPPGTQSGGGGEAGREGNIPRPEHLGSLVLLTHNLLIGRVIPSLNRITHIMARDANLTDMYQRGRAQALTWREGALIQQLGVYLMELGRCMQATRLGRTPSESFVNAGSPLYLTANGPAPLLVQHQPPSFQVPLGLSIGGGLGQPVVGTVNIGGLGTVGVGPGGSQPGHAQVRVHAQQAPGQGGAAATGGQGGAGSNAGPGPNVGQSSGPGAGEGGQGAAPPGGGGPGTSQSTVVLGFDGAGLLQLLGGLGVAGGAGIAGGMPGMAMQHTSIVFGGQEGSVGAQGAQQREDGATEEGRDPRRSWNPALQPGFFNRRPGPHDTDGTPTARGPSHVTATADVPAAATTTTTTPAVAAATTTTSVATTTATATAPSSTTTTTTTTVARSVPTSHSDSPITTTYDAQAGGGGAMDPSGRGEEGTGAGRAPGGGSAEAGSAGGAGPGGPPAQPPPVGLGLGLEDSPLGPTRRRRPRASAAFATAAPYPPSGALPGGAAAEMGEFGSLLQMLQGLAVPSPSAGSGAQPEGRPSAANQQAPAGSQQQQQQGTTTEGQEAGAARGGAGASLAQGIGAMVDQMLQNPQMEGLVRQVVSQAGPGGIRPDGPTAPGRPGFGGAAAGSNPLGGVDFGQVMQQMMPVVSQILGGLGGPAGAGMAGAGQRPPGGAERGGADDGNNGQGADGTGNWQAQLSPDEVAEWSLVISADEALQRNMPAQGPLSETYTRGTVVKRQKTGDDANGQAPSSAAKIGGDSSAGSTLLPVLHEEAQGQQGTDGEQQQE